MSVDVDEEPSAGTPQEVTGGTDATVVVQAGQQRSARIESLRAVAALAVLVSHVWLYSHHFAPESYDSFLHRAIAGGGFGVQLFFALSGFLIFRPFARRDFGSGEDIDLRTYTWNRAIRILPLYWAAVTILLIFTANGGSFEQWWRFTFFAQEFSTRTAQTVDGPMWSLVVELIFYIVLPALAFALAWLCRGNRGRAIAVLCGVGLVSVVFRRIDPDPKVIWEYSFPGTFFGFVPGMVLALLQLSWQERRPTIVRGLAAHADAWLAVGAVCWAIVFWKYDLAVPGTAVAAFFTVGAVVLPLDQGSIVRVLDWRPLALIGVASYSLYIWHVPIIEHLYKHDVISSFPRLLVVATPLALAAAAASYLVIERTALQWRRSWASVPVAGAAAIDGGRPEASTSPLDAAPVRSEQPRDRLVSMTSWWTDRRVMTAIAIVAFFTRARTAMWLRGVPLGADPTDYDRLGRLLASGKGFGTSILSPSGGPTVFRPPLYPLFVGAIYKVTGNSMTAVRLVQAVLGVVTVLLVWAIARKLFDRRVAIVAAAITAVYPPLIFATEALMSESVLVPLLLGAVLAALHARDGGAQARRWAIASGALMGLGVLARPNTSVALVGILVLALGWRRGSWDRAAGMRRAGALIVALIAVMVPWEVYAYVVTDHVVPVSDVDGYNFAGVYNADSANAAYPQRYQFRPPVAVADFAPLFADRSLDEISLGEKLRQRGVDWIRDHPTAPVQALAWNSLRLIEVTGVDTSAASARELGYGRKAAALGMVSFWLIAALALVALVRRRVAGTPIGLWLVPIVLWLGAALFLGEPRLRAPIDPFLIIAAAAAIVTFVARRRPVEDGA